MAALALTITVAMLSAVMFEGSMGQIHGQAATIDKRRSFYLAEAGLAEGMQLLRLGGTGNVGSPALPARFGDGGFWVETTQDTEGNLHLKATGIAGRARTCLGIVVTQEVAFPAALGIFGDEELVIGPGVLIGAGSAQPTDDGDDGDGDGGDSVAGLGWNRTLLSDSSSAGAGAWGTAETDSSATIDLDGARLVMGSNGSIRFESTGKDKTRVVGDATPGPDGLVEIGVGVEITGSTAPRASAAEMPAIVLPELNPTGNLSLGKSQSDDGRTVGLDPGDHALGTARIGKGAELLLTGPTVLSVDRLLVEKGGRIEVDTSAGPVRIVVHEGMKIEHGGEIANPDESPSGLELSVLGSADVDVDGDGTLDPAATFGSVTPFYGMLYAPNAALELPAGSSVHGSVAARRLSIGAGSSVSFDETLLAVGATRALQHSAWQALEVPEEVRTDLRADLMAELAEAAGQPLPSPAEAGHSAAWAIQYTCAEGGDWLWMGEEERFDWEAVATVRKSGALGTGDGSAGAEQHDDWWSWWGGGWDTGWECWDSGKARFDWHDWSDWGDWGSGSAWGGGRDWDSGNSRGDVDSWSSRGR